MKRIRDKVYASGSHFRRRLTSSRGGLSPVHGSGDTEEEGGGRVTGEEITSQKLATNDALSYLKEVKEMFQHQRETYDSFLQVMKDFKAQRIDTDGVTARVKELFKGHNHLILGFNTFLPKDHQITLTEEDDQPLPKKTVEFEEAISFVNKIKMRFKHDEHVYKSFLSILNMYRKENKEISEVYDEVSILFEGHSDLLEEFTRFLPASLPSHSAALYSRSQAQRYNDRGTCPPQIRQMRVEKESRRERAIASGGDNIVDRYGLSNDKTIVKMQREQQKGADKENRERKGRDRDDTEAGKDDLHYFPERKNSSRRAEGPEAHSGSASQSEKDNLKSMYNQAFVFCEKVKKGLRSQDDYQTFLKCLNLFSNGIIQRDELQNLVSDILGKHPDLMDEFNQFFERCDSIDGFQRLAGVMSKKSLDFEEQVSRSMKVEEKGREHKPDLEVVNETEQYKEYVGKSIQELDLSDCECCTPSYRLLPPDYPVPTASQRSELGAEVLNDHWVSVTSGSEDYSFKHMHRNQYEESLFRCEDDRFELDMLVESVSSAARSADNLLNIITEKKITFSGSFRIEDHFTALNVRCIERLYGEHGLDVIDILHKKPATALPVILTRLKQKRDEWKKCREDFDKVWAKVYAKNHYKSLDHRSFYFKQQDSKNLSAKSLVTEIKELEEKFQNEDDMLLSISAGYRQPINPNLDYEYCNRAIHEDLYRLVQFSCEELCSTKEQLTKVLRLWENFLEAVMGVPPRAKGTDAVEDVVVKLNTLDVNHSTPTTSEDAKGSSGGSTSLLASRKSKFAANVVENTSSGASNQGATSLFKEDSTGNENLKDADTVNRAGIACSAVKLQKEQESGNGADKRYKMPIPMNTSGRASIWSLSIPSGGENNHGVVGKEDLAGSHENQSKPDNTLSDIRHGVDRVETSPSTQVGDVGKSIALARGVRSDSSKTNRKSDEPEAPPTIEKEEGELSPNGNFEDNFGLSEDLGVKSTSKPENSADAEVENDCHENALEGGEDASGTESGGEECSDDENREEEVGEHDDGKAESEPEAEGLDSHLLEGDSELPSQSERVLLSVRPLSKHVAAVLRDERAEDFRVFYGNDDFYLLFRLHQILYERILSAKMNCSGDELKDSDSLDPYARFVKVLYGLLDGSVENTKFEDECRAIYGNQSYVLFTLDKVMYKLVKQLQAVVADDMDNKLIELYEYEKSRKPGRVIDSVYYENARVLLQDENIYRLECSSSPSRLSIQLMDNIIEKPEAYAVSMDPMFASYLQTEFLSTSSGKKEEGHDIMLQRNRRLYSSGLYDLAELCKAMEGVEVVNGLECKMSGSSYKVSYVLDTEDFFHRKQKKKKKKTEHISQRNKDRVERFHRFLSASR